MKIAKLTSVLLIISLLLFGCKGLSKPKPTEEGALAFAKKFWKAIDEKDYETAYELLSSKNKKLITKVNYVKALKEDSDTDIFPTKVVSARLEGNIAIVTLSIKNLVGGTSSDEDRIVFENGEWRQQLEPSTLLSYSVAPEEIKEINKTSINKKIIIPAFDAVIKKVEESNISTGDFGLRKTAEGKYVIITALIKNTGKQKFNFDAEQFYTLIDNQQRNFEYILDAPGNTLDTEISPGMEKTIKTFFDVPKDAKGFRLLVGEVETEQYLVSLNK